MPKLTRRESLKLAATGAAALALHSKVTMAASDVSAELKVTLENQFELSPYLYMQFMEPLGTTDGSVEAAWDHKKDTWREDVVKVTSELAPPMVRWGGIFTDYYRWREGVGPREKRPPMLNLLWGGMESNQVGTTEFVDFCHQVKSEPLLCVNFESDGRKRYMESKGSVRTADAREAADWVAYCNQPNNAERKGHGHKAPLPIKYWQLGNETSYDRNGFNLETAAAKMVEFARAMRGVDPTIQLVGWGDSDWAGRVLEVAGEHLQYLAFHNMFNPDSKQPVLQGELYRRDPAATWEVLMNAWHNSDNKIRRMRDNLGKKKFPLAMTECHFAIPGRHRCDVLSTWAAGVSYARILNTHQRHGDVLKIATAADFCGTRWQVNAVMIPTPGGKSYLMPVARVMRLYHHHSGSHFVPVTGFPEGLDVVASRRADTVYLHVVNTRRNQSVRTRLAVAGRNISSGRIYQIADDPMVEVSQMNSAEVMQIIEKDLPADATWEFPAASVSAVEIKVG
jgi:alpha-L-arabinofuranosidase